MTPRILVAEDDVKQARLIRIYLEREGHDVQLVADGRAAIDRARTTRPDLVVLDVMMPLVDGLDVCRVLRMESRVPILLLTARTTEEDLLLGLDLGADDYMTKPYSPRELTARVRALLRRAGGAAEVPAPAVIRVGGIEIDPELYEVRADGRPVPLTGKEFAILHLLAKSPGRVFTRGQIIDRVFGFDQSVLERTVDAHVMNLRRKLEADGLFPRVVETVYGRGYRLSVPRPAAGATRPPAAPGAPGPADGSGSGSRPR
ncbi:response regulator transcription factor [Streptomyces sp. NPDC058953]|uniref:response regulator transcription factor n=1 Tax=unclassified Streptomyces TaxID=2593676 RepID=UPI0036B78E8F